MAINITPTPTTSSELTDLAAGVSTFLGTPSSANLRSAMTDEIGTGACVFDGATLTQTLTLATTGSSLAPINIPAGTLETTPNDGDIEADANCIYGCTDAGNRGVIPLRYIIRADSTVTQANDANAHAIFTTPTNGRLTLETGTYVMSGLLAWSSMSATSGNLKFDFLGGGTASLGTVIWMPAAIDVAAGNNAALQGASYVATGSNASATAAGTATGYILNTFATFEVTGAGTLIPTQTLATAAAAVLTAGSYLMFERIGSTSMTSVGQWD